MPARQTPALGQHWLTDKDCLHKIASLAQLTVNQTVVEIGAGPGGLTDCLLAFPAKVLAVEYDTDLFNALKKRYNPTPDSLELIQADIRQFNWSSLPKDYKICANIPYYLSANLMRALTDTDNKPTLAVLLLPEAVAVKLASQDKRSLLATIVQSHYQIDLDLKVAPQSFDPPPQIMSQVAIFRRQWAYFDLDQKDWQPLLRLYKAAFANPRKQLGNNLRVAYQLSASKLQNLLAGLSLSYCQRAETLSCEQWTELFACLRDQQIIP